MSENYKEFPFGPNKNDPKYTGDTKTAFPDKIEDLIRDGIIESYANTDLEAEESTFVYGSGGPSVLSKL